MEQLEHEMKEKKKVQAVWSMRRGELRMKELT
jgi:hypothetical protein